MMEWAAIVVAEVRNVAQVTAKDERAPAAFRSRTILKVSVTQSQSALVLDVSGSCTFLDLKMDDVTLF